MNQLQKKFATLAVLITSSSQIWGAGTENAQSTLLGLGAGASLTASAHNSTLIGVDAGNAITTANANTFVGSRAGKDTTTGYNNTFVGEYAGNRNTLGINNTFIGQNTGSANTLGTQNTFIGQDAGFSNTTGYYNTYVGISAGRNSSSGHSNVFIGRRAGFAESSSQKLYIENSGSTSPLIYGEFDNDLVGINGDLGVGTQMPGASVHVRRADGSAQILVEETSGSTSPRTLLSLQNAGRAEIVMGNTGTGGEWSFGAGTNFILKQGAVGTDSSTKTKHLTLFAGTGNLQITGSIITGGPACSSGCDAVFSEDYELPSIKQHAEEMYALGHLPNVGPTSYEQPVNLTDKIGKLLNELEHAHIYIAQLEQRVTRQQSELSKYKYENEVQNDILDAFAARVEKLESTR